MWNGKQSVWLSIGVCIAVSLLLLVLIFFGPKLFWAYMTVYRGIAPDSAVLQMLRKVFAFTFYPCAFFAAIILYSLLKLLFNIKNGNVFIIQNAKILKNVSWCCFVISVITLLAGRYYMPFLFVAGAGIFVGILLRVLKNVMQSAVELREENDLTI